MKKFVLLMMILILIPVFWFIGIKGMSINETIDYFKKAFAGEL